jgi:hypothetical protein
VGFLGVCAKGFLVMCSILFYKVTSIIQKKKKKKKKEL